MALESFSLVNKRDMNHNKMEFDKHSVITFRGAPYGIFLSVDTFPQSYKEWEELSREIWEYLR